MHEPVFVIALIWHVLLLLVLAAYGARVRDLLDRLLALDTVTPIFVAAIALVAIHRGESDYLEVALVVALLGFTQTVVTARYARARHREERHD